MNQSPFIQVAIFRKNDNFAVLSLFASTTGTVIGRNDPRAQPIVSHCVLSSPQSGFEKFQEAIECSVDNGHKVVFRGTPNNARLS